MKRLLFPVVLVVLIAALFTSCKKDDPNAIFNTSFFTTKQNGKLSLYVDGNYKGVLPYFSKEPACGAQNGDGQLPMSMQLKTGEYHIEGQDSTGKVVSSGTIYISKSTNSMSGGIGGQSTFNNGECVVIGLFE